MTRRTATVIRVIAVRRNTTNRRLRPEEGTAFTTYLFRFTFLFFRQVAILTSDFPGRRETAMDCCWSTKIPSLSIKMYTHAREVKGKKCKPEQ